MDMTYYTRSAKWFCIWVVGDRIAERQEITGLDHIMLMQQYTGVSYEKILASWHRLFERVVPRFGTQSIAQKRELTDA